MSYFPEVIPSRRAAYPTSLEADHHVGSDHEHGDEEGAPPVGTEREVQCLEAAGKIGMDALAVATDGGSEALEAAAEEVAEDAGADAADAGASRGPSFVAKSNEEVIRVPEGAEDASRHF